MGKTMARKIATFVLIVAQMMAMTAGTQLLPAMNAEWATILYLGMTIAAIAVHEAGHAIVAHKLGAQIRVIAVLGIGYDFIGRRFGIQKAPGQREIAGYVRYALPRFGARTNARVWIAASGPLANMATGLAAIAIRFADLNATLSGALAIFLVMSLGMAGANLVPFPASDGEQILDEIRRRRGL